MTRESSASQKTKRPYIASMSDPATPSPAPRLAPCPICGKLPVPQFRPFCSKRCADVDLNRWLSGVYTVPVTEDTDEDGETVRDQERDDTTGR
jgi:endogenous inhibitor of DNA gyrase (YacG/DUF329 family)